MKNRQRLLSVFIAATYSLATWAHAGWQPALALLLPLTVTLALIWYAEEIGNYTGWASRIPVSHAAPPRLMRVFGWCVLLTPAAIYVIRSLQGLLE